MWDRTAVLSNPAAKMGRKVHVIPSALAKGRWYPRRLARRQLTPAGAFVSDVSETMANGVSLGQGAIR
jgi:hypothetical protein